MKLYYDEPIRRPDSYRTPAPKPALPKRYLEMRTLAAKHTATMQSAESLFYKQGMFMADFEDDYAFHGNFIRYYPTYQAMNNEQLRGYFSWRTKVRHGDIQKTELSFVYVYIYELLNQIGVSSAEEGFQALQHFRSVYKNIDSRTDRFLKTWMKDYVIYNNLDAALIPEFSVSSAYEQALNCLINCELSESDTLFSALCELSSYKICNSRFYKEYPEDTKTVVCNVYRRFSSYYDTHKKCSYFVHLFGNKMIFPRNMFSFAVFYDRKRYEDYEYAISDIHKYHCKNGHWSLETYPSLDKRNTELGLIIKAIDRLMRKAYKYKHTLNAASLPLETELLIQKEIDAFLEEKRKRSQPRIDIDLSRLSAIRAASDITRDKLITEEEKDADEAINMQQEQERSTSESLLDDTERQFLERLLLAQPYDDLLKEKALPLSVIVDAVNEKLFDLFQDTPIVFEGDTPVLIEDYIDELKGL